MKLISTIFMAILLSYHTLALPIEISRLLPRQIEQDLDPRGPEAIANFYSRESLFVRSIHEGEVDARDLDDVDMHNRDDLYPRSPKATKNARRRARYKGSQRNGPYSRKGPSPRRNSRAKIPYQPQPQQDHQYSHKSPPQQDSLQSPPQQNHKDPDPDHQQDPHGHDHTNDADPPSGVSDDPSPNAQKRAKDLVKKFANHPFIGTAVKNFSNQIIEQSQQSMYGGGYR